MAKRDYYNTKQKDKIIEAIKNQEYEFTIKDIYKELKGQVGLTTIYRITDKLIEEGIINRYLSKRNITYYQYLKECSEENHFYLKCDKCGELVHVDCNCIEKLSSHIIKTHGFVLQKKNTILTGICKKCSKTIKKYKANNNEEVIR